MTLAEASGALSENLEPGEEEASEGCSYIAPKSIPHGAAFMVIDGRIERVDVDTTGILTVSGAQVGSTEDDIRSLYRGQIRIEPHPYDGPEWHYLIFVPKDPVDSSFGIIFETDGATASTVIELDASQLYRTSRGARDGVRPNKRLKLSGAIVLEEAECLRPAGRGRSSTALAPASESPAA